MIHPGRTLISNVPTLDSAPESIRTLILKLNPHIYTPPITHPTQSEARSHIETMDLAIDLCARVLRLDVTKRLTAAEALRHPFFSQVADKVDLKVLPVLGAKQGKCGRLHCFDKNGKRELRVIRVRVRGIADVVY